MQYLNALLDTMYLEALCKDLDKLKKEGGYQCDANPATRPQVRRPSTKRSKKVGSTTGQK